MRGEPGPVRALESSAPYSARLSARSALYADLQVLLDATREPQSSTAYRSLVIDDNCVARKSVCGAAEDLEGAEGAVHPRRAGTRSSPGFCRNGGGAAPNRNAG